MFVITDTAVREQFVDHMMRNLTSETVFLLTTFVNMATSCGSSTAEEIEFINTVTLELFEVFTIIIMSVVLLDEEYHYSILMLSDSAVTSC